MHYASLHGVFFLRGMHCIVRTLSDNAYVWQCEVQVSNRYSSVWQRKA